MLQAMFGEQAEFLPQPKRRHRTAEGVVDDAYALGFSGEWLRHAHLASEQGDEQNCGELYRQFHNPSRARYGAESRRAGPLVSRERAAWKFNSFKRGCAVNFLRVCRARPRRKPRARWS